MKTSGLVQPMTNIVLVNYLKVWTCMRNDGKHFPELKTSIQPVHFRGTAVVIQSDVSK